MNALTTFEPSAKALAMVATARAEEGARNPVSEGAVCLAEFLISSRRSAEVVAFLGGWSGANRLLADAYMPGQDIGGELGYLTKGVVEAKMWRRPWDGTLDYAAAADVMRGAEEALALSPRLAAQPFPVLGQLGAIPPGPLFRHFPVPDQPNARVVTGFGFAVAGGDAELCALRDTVTAAIDAIRGGAQA